MRISDWSSDVCASDLLGSFAADALTEPLLMMFKTPFADKRLTLEARIEGDVVLVSDKPLLMRALANLLSNSYQYSDRGGARIALAREGERAPITVADTRSEEHTSELQSLMRISYAGFCLKNKQKDLH